MTTITDTPAPTPAPAAARPSTTVTAAAGRLTFDGVLRSEWIKLLSLRSIRWSIAVMVVLSWAGAMLMAIALAGTEFNSPTSLTSLLAQSATFTSNLTVLIMGVLGVLAFTNEYSSGLILSSLSSVPSRTPLFLAKTLVVAALGLAVGVVSIFGGALIAAVIYGEGGFTALGDPAVLLSLLGTSCYLALAALLALGLGALLRSSAGAISVVVILLFVSTLVFQILAVTGWTWVSSIAQWLPADLGYELSTAALMPADAPAEAAGVGYWAALAGLAAWATAALVPAAFLFKTRDAV